MRLWTLHPKYLDSAGLVALWREALLAQAVLSGRTRGYRHHPQLERFRAQANPAASLAAYLQGVYLESLRRGYRFDESKIGHPESRTTIPVTDGQLRFEWRHLMRKLAQRAPQLYRSQRAVDLPDPHPLFEIVLGPIADWERGSTR
jgi:hypothetical protein